MSHENRIVEPLRLCSNSELRMKILVFLAGLALASMALADIHDPPSNDYGPTRKFGRGFAILVLAPAEIAVTICTVNTNGGNSAAAGHGVRRGLRPSAARLVAGLRGLLRWSVAAY